MSGSTLTAFNYIPELSEATPGLWNSVFSILSQNITEANSVGTIVSQISTLGVVTINAPSTSTDYIHFHDTSAAKSDYLIGSFTTGTADGLNIYDVSGQTMIVSFSKQSVRFYQNIVGPVFDTGGALASTYNAATFGSGADSKESRIQAAINQAALDSVARVYVPANMLPYSASSISFIYTVQMTREGGNSAVYDARAYGAAGNGVTSDNSAVQGAINAAVVNNSAAYFSTGTYLVGTSATWAVSTNTQVRIVGDGGAWLKLAPNMGIGSEILRVNTRPSVDSTNDVQITNMGFDGSAQSRMFGVRAMYTNRLTIDNCRFTGFFHQSLALPGYCIYASGSTTSVPGSPFSWTTVAPTGWTTGTKILNSQFWSSTSDSRGTLGAQAVFLYYHDGGVIAQNVCDTLCVPILVLGWTRGITISDNLVINSTDDGIRFEADDSIAGTSPLDMEAIICTGNVVRNSFKDGIRATCNKSVVANNSSSFNKLAGVAAVVMRNTVVANNDLHHNENRGLYLVQTSISGWSTHENVLITGNYCNQNAIAGIDVIGGGDLNSSAASNIQIHNNLCTENGAIGISLRDCANVRVTHNLCHSNNTSDVSNNGQGIVHQANNVAASAGNCFFGWNRVFDPRPSSKALQNIAIELFASPGKTLLSNEFYFNDVSGTVSNGSFTLRGFWTTAGGTVNGSLFVGNKIGTMASATGYATQSTDTIIGQSALGPIQYHDGTAILPAVAWFSENSLGWYRSGASAVGLSYGQVQLPTGTALQPSLAFSSESSLGWYRSGASAIGISYGQVQIVSGTPTLPGLAFSSESSLGFFRSASSTIELSYGTLRLDGGILSLGTGGISASTWKMTAAGALTLSSTGAANYFNLAVPVTQTDGSAAVPSLTYNSEAALGWYRSGASTVALSYGTFNLAKNAVRLSMRTLAASAVTASAAKTNVAVDEVVFTIGGASGASLIIYSGGTAYGFNSAFSAAAS